MSFVTMYYLLTYGTEIILRLWTNLGHFQKVQLRPIFLKHRPAVLLPRSSWSITSVLHQYGRLRPTSDRWRALRTERGTWRRLRVHLRNHRHRAARRRLHTAEVSANGHRRRFLRRKTVVERKVVREGGRQRRRNSVDDGAVQRSLRTVEEAAGRGRRPRGRRLRRRGPLAREGVASRAGRHLRRVLRLLTGRGQNSMVVRLRGGFRTNGPPNARASECRSPFRYNSTAGVRQQTALFVICGRRGWKAVSVAFFRRQVRPGEWCTRGPTQHAAGLLAVVVDITGRSVSTGSAPWCFTSANCEATILTCCCKHIYSVIRFWPSADMLPEFKNWDMQNLEQIFSPCSRGLARRHVTRQRCSVAPEPKLTGPENYFPLIALGWGNLCWWADVLRGPKVSTAMGTKGTDYQCWPLILLERSSKLRCSTYLAGRPSDALYMIQPVDTWQLSQHNDLQLCHEMNVRPSRLVPSVWNNPAGSIIKHVPAEAKLERPNHYYYSASSSLLVVQYTRLSIMGFSGRCFPAVEHSAAERHICIVTNCF